MASPQSQSTAATARIPDDSNSAFLADMLCIMRLTTLRPVTVNKPIPYTFDLGNLTVFDANPLSSPTQEDLNATARDCAQALLNQLLTTVPITSTPSGVHLVLPEPSFALPREKPLPAAKAQSKWERFAAAKGIQKKAREGKLQYNEETGEWVPRYGFGRKKDEDDWLVEVDDKKGEKEEGGVRKERREERKERIKRQERRERANQARSVKGKG